MGHSYLLSVRSSDWCLSPYKSLLEWVFSSLQFYSFPEHNPIFKDRCFGAHLSCAGSKVWGTWYEAGSFYSSGKHSIPFISLLIMTHSNWGVVFPLANLCFCLFPLLMLSFYLLLWRLHSFHFQVPFRGSYSICSCVVVSMGEGGSGSCWVIYLEPNSTFRQFWNIKVNI